MKKAIVTLVFALMSAVVFGDSITPKVNKSNPKEYGEPVEQVYDIDGEKIVLKVEVKLQKPIVMGCQYIYRITNTSGKTVKVHMYALTDQKADEKIKAGDSIEFLTNTMTRCEGEDKIGKCTNCHPDLHVSITSVK